MTCVCGCGQWAPLQHHAIYRQHLRRVARSKDATRSFTSLIDDNRNKVWVHPACHGLQHNRQRPLSLACLPDSVYEFALEVLGANTAYSLLSRAYDGGDDRLERLVPYGA